MQTPHRLLGLFVMAICMRGTTVRHVHGSSSTSYGLQKHYSKRLAVLLTATALVSCLMANQKVPNSDANGILKTSMLSLALSSPAWYSAA